ncbi:hypothetical protein HPB49_013599 [Dermacentor silvarum]|uniref:Uncharacterized protein n=1 Tax=Dermacentor silvarum TaxID=543639 RepID=A0ACB8E0X5_DERSI|nr:hypothetical protein HPB49_013599 [Dermacentor silvarum]
MDCEVEGEILTPEDFTKDSGWQLVAARRSTRRRNAAANQTGADVVEVQPNAGSNARCRPDHAGIKSKIIRGGRMPPLPKEEAKIIVRPRGGLCISKVGPTAVADAIWQAAGLDSATRDTDTMCPNFQQNIMETNTLILTTNTYDVTCTVVTPSCGGGHESQRRFDKDPHFGRDSHRRPHAEQQHANTAQPPRRRIVNQNTSTLEVYMK